MATAVHDADKPRQARHRRGQPRAAEAKPRLRGRNLEQPRVYQDEANNTWLEIQWTDLCKLEQTLGFIAPGVGEKADWLGLHERLVALGPNLYRNVGRGRHAIRLRTEAEIRRESPVMSA